MDRLSGLLLPEADPVALERGRTSARQRGLDEPVEFVAAEVATWRGSAERALCVGSSHAFGGSGAALEALATVVPSGGWLLFGDGWTTSSPPRARGGRNGYWTTAPIRGPGKCATGSTRGNGSTSTTPEPSSASPT